MFRKNVVLWFGVHQDSLKVEDLIVLLFVLGKEHRAEIRKRRSLENVPE